MIIETQEAVVMHEDEDLAATLMGGIWSDFKDSIPEPQAKILTEGFNLILLSDPAQTQNEDLEDPDFLTGRSGSLVPNLITEILIDENTHIPEKKNSVFQIITGNIIETLVKMGFTLNEDEVSQDRLMQLCQLVHLFYDLQNYQDLIGLAGLLESTDIPPKERYLMLMQRYKGDHFDIDVYELMVDDVSEVTLKAIRDALVQEEAVDMPPQNIITRIVQNKELLDGTLVYTHIRNNGQIGGSVQSFLNFYSRELEEYTDEPTPEKLVAFGKEVTAIFLASELNNPVLKDRLISYLSGVITDYKAMVDIETLINRLVLTDD
jgi:hypothetical protein